MYDILETDMSFDYTKKLFDKCKDIKIGLIGGWATYFYVNNDYKKAFGIEYLKSRDIDVFVKSRDLTKFKATIKKLGFEASGYSFRYELIYDRTNGKIVNHEESKSIPVFNLVYIFLDVFSDKESKGIWYLKFLNKVQIIQNKYPLIDINTLLNMKSYSFFEREKLHKELKDAADIYALLIYSNQNYNLNKLIKEAIKKIISRNNISEFIAENILKDYLKYGIVKQSLQNLL